MEREPFHYSRKKDKSHHLSTCRSLVVYYGACGLLDQHMLLIAVVTIGAFGIINIVHVPTAGTLLLCDFAVCRCLLMLEKFDLMTLRADVDVNVQAASQQVWQVT